MKGFISCCEYYYQKCHQGSKKADQMLPLDRQKRPLKCFVDSIGQSPAKEGIVVEIHHTSKHIQETNSIAICSKTLRSHLFSFVHLAINLILASLPAWIIRVKLSSNVPQSTIKIISEGSRNDGKHIQDKIEIINKIADTIPTVRVK